MFGCCLVCSPPLGNTPQMANLETFQTTKHVWLVIRPILVTESQALACHWPRFTQNFQDI